uniref:Uncharacterized protein n=1 Tax=Leersia perrieri TaxID=77586 RepID=A0A0D9W5V8_9ORYZ
MMKETGLSLAKVTGQKSPPKYVIKAGEEKWKYKYGEPLVRPDLVRSLLTQMFKLHRWYIEACKEGTQFINVKIKDEHYFRGEDLINIDVEELYQLFQRDALDKSLVSCWCLLDMLRHKREGVYDIGFIDPYVVHSTNIVDQAEEMERNILRFLGKQAHKTKIFFPYCLGKVHFKRAGEWKVPLSVNANKGTNLCAFYVAESIMSRGQRTYSALSDLEYRRDRVAEEDKHKAIQKVLAGLLNDKILDPKGEHCYDGRLGPASVDYNIDLDDPNFD